jgi:spermidine synthase
MSTVGRIGDMCTSIQIVDLDEGVFNTSRKYFQKYNRLDSLENWQFEADDAKHFLANNSEKYDLILHDIPPAKSRQIALTYTREFFQSVKNNLTDRGIFSISSLTPLNSKSTYGLRMMATLADVFDEYFILTYKNGVYFFGGNETLIIADVNGIRESINHTDSKRVRILTKEEIEGIVKGADVITINNLRDLIFD